MAFHPVVIFGFGSDFLYFNNLFLYHLEVRLESFIYRWSRLEHPRFGLIIAIRAIIDMKKGSEVLVNYGMQMAEAPVWYKSLWVKYLRETKCLSDDGIKDWCSRQYSMYGKIIDLPLEEQQ